MAETVSTAAGTYTGAGVDSVPEVPSVVRVGERTRFTVELRPGETTIVSWKKLMKDASKSVSRGEASSAIAAASTTASAVVISAPEVPAVSIPALEARLAPVLGQPAADEDGPAQNRFSAVIEKIERLYKGKDSSDDEDLNDVPDDDQYDTEDSFIDDAELDEYFQVDKSKTKHDGYFVNRGMLEKVIEPSEPANQQPKKRRRKEMPKDPSNNDDGQRASKHVKAVKKGTEIFPAAEKGVLHTSDEPSLKCFKETNFQNHLKIPTDGKPLMDPLLRIQDDVSLTLAEISDNHKTGIPFKNLSGNDDRIESMHKSHSLVNKFEESEIVKQQKGKSSVHERIDLNLPDTKHSLLPVKSSVVHKKEGSSVKSKVNVLEKAIRELEKMVAELRPPALDAQDGDSSSHCIKRRLPREVKQKLAKVARLAHASNGTVSNELLSRLMGILGHICQVRTLKRHLKVMVTTSLSAKQEKDEKYQVIKKEVTKMVEAYVPSLISKAAEQKGGESGDLHVSSHPENAAKGQLFMNCTLEDRICDLYDIFVDGLDEDAAPQVRKLYAELAELWPKGIMDNHGIKHAICRAKERRRTLNDTNKDQEKIRRKKPITTNTEGSVHMESNLAAQSQYPSMVGTDPNSTDVTQHNWSSSTSFGSETTNGPLNTAPTFTSSINVSNLSGPKHENLMGIHKSSLPAARVVVDGAGMAVKKKVKKRAERLVGDVNMGLDKLSSHQVDDKQKQDKHPGVSLQGGSHKSSYDGFQFDPSS